jgi:hypothetical protein
MQRVERIGPGTEGPSWVLPVAGVRRVDRRRDDEPDRDRRRRPGSPRPADGEAAGPDADGHVDLTA